ncbi:MAG: potassium transporter Kup [Oligoflexales bacterium]
MSSTSHGVGNNRSPLALTTLGALGVVYGDIGTSPLYAMRECFHGPHSIALTPGNLIGVLSLILWSLILIISVKYAGFVLRADNKGEGGILALIALLHPRAGTSRSGKLTVVMALGLFGAALLYGDGIITPAISVLSAVEGLKIATPMFEPYIILITLAILVGLFMAQSHGTARIGKAFGPIILVWFVTLGALGVRGILDEPHVLVALNPLMAYKFMAENSWHGFVVLGSVFLVVTGGEALYADLGHFGKTAIRRGWFFVALPGLVLQYFGQGALLLKNPAAAENPFYLLAPSWGLFPLVILATAATIIASQAMITGAFSLSQQAIQLGFLPRLEVKHTSAKEMGQIYVPFINWILLFGTVSLVLEFGSSSSLAAAYGIAVVTTMVITTICIFSVMRRRWEWSLFATLPFLIVFLSIDLAFFGANLIKVLDGGWFPLLLGTGIFLLMTTWKRGRQLLAERLMARSMPLEKFMQEMLSGVRIRIPGAAIFMTATPKGTPSALVQNVIHNQVLRETIVVLTLATEDAPYIAPEERLSVDSCGNGFYRVIARYGFMEVPHVPNLLASCNAQGVTLDPENMTFFLGRETFIATDRPGMAIWRERLFSFMSRNAQRATDYFKIPADKAIEIGTVVEI